MSVTLKGNKLYLKTEEGKEKMLATKTDYGVFIVKQRDKHLLRMDKSYGVNKELLESLNEEEIVRLSDGHGSYQLPVATIKASGVEREFSYSTPEPQLFIPLAVWENNKVD